MRWQLPLVALALIKRMKFAVVLAARALGQITFRWCLGSKSPLLSAQLALSAERLTAEWAISKIPLRAPLVVALAAQLESRPPVGPSLLEMVSAAAMARAQCLRPMEQLVVALLADIAARAPMELQS
jgi:hypothetical protein